MKKEKRLLSGAIIGTVLTLICCATPVLVILFGAIGLGAFTGYLDYVLIPALFVFIGLTAYAYNKYRKRSG